MRRLKIIIIIIIIVTDLIFVTYEFLTCPGFALSFWKCHNKTTAAPMPFEIWIRNLCYEKNGGQLRRISAALRAKFFPESRSVNLLCFYCWLYFREIASKLQIKGMGIRSSPIFVFLKKCVMFVENGTVRILTCAILVKDFIYFLFFFLFFIFVVQKCLISISKLLRLAPPPHAQWILW